MYRYCIYGLGIHTEIKLYNLQEQEIPKDVYIHYGEVSEDIKEYAGRGLASTMSPNRVWFRNDIGHFVITNGKDILVQPLASRDENDLASFILGWCIAFLFQQRGYTAIHSSAIEVGNQAVLVAGFSGAGKSTIALSMIEAGYRYLSDDIVMVNPMGDMMIQPAFPQQKVCRNLAEQMGTDSLLYINEKKDKFAYYNNKDFCDEPRKLTIMVMLKKYEGNHVLVEEVTGVEKLNCIFLNLFLLDAYRAMGFTREEKARCLELAGKLSVYRISRPVGQDTVQEIRDIIIQLVKR